MRGLCKERKSESKVPEPLKKRPKLNGESVKELTGEPQTGVGLP